MSTGVVDASVAHMKVPKSSEEATELIELDLSRLLD
jgi:hypothetical protein